MLLKQYAQILDMKYRDSSNEKIEEALIQNSLAQQVDHPVSRVQVIFATVWRDLKVFSFAELVQKPASPEDHAG